MPLQCFFNSTGIYLLLLKRICNSSGDYEINFAAFRSQQNKNISRVKSFNYHKVKAQLAGALFFSLENDTCRKRHGVRLTVSTKNA